MATQFPVVISTTLTLLEKFQATLASPTTATAQAPSKDANASAEADTTTNALPLLSNSAAVLKSQVTKLSLLAITAPFTHSAVSTVLRACNESVLPSLVTAALLVTPAGYTQAFHTEILLLVKTALVEFSTLVRDVKGIAETKDLAKRERDAKKEKEGEISKIEKDAVMVAVGRVWDACDAVTEVAGKGVVGFVMRRVEQWRDLVKDAVEELEDWDPEEDDEFFDELMGEEKGDDNDDDDEDEDEEEDTAALQENKKSTLRFIKPIAQVYPAILTNRLKNAGDKPLSSTAGIAKLESLMINLQSIPDQVDEAAGALYENNWSKAAEYLKKTQKNAAQAVNSVSSPWIVSEIAEGEQQPADKFATWSKMWLKVMDEVSKPIDAAVSE
ncbi:uncharacterized protein N7473_006941 [Penicillium subrubescens]|jgi:hypothetical protein|uniref:Cyclin-D1-binding protein 1-like N-terminal domain-containing protein n=1 Tax=Penicillium subrubescens TaxID=1316194 RepID=A0A1Q5TFX7_9EURO|nr:uncharacterized protein N7473_006941 [Penicillium subrubescens]KAJ5890713.1 hypothetical protein N7473_006941 [Penicillium subrubescens]OKO99134.1 hypothetical protein PENSUB_8520 [Penicillium subrubescens]